MSRRENFIKVLQKHGYRSINSFCLDNKLQQTNVNKRIKDETIKVDLNTLFVWANILHEPIEDLIKIFYPDEWNENRDLID